MKSARSMAMEVEDKKVEIRPAQYYFDLIEDVNKTLRLKSEPATFQLPATSIWNSLKLGATKLLPNDNTRGSASKDRDMDRIEAAVRSEMTRIRIGRAHNQQPLNHKLVHNQQER
jgi:hypothetical protein